jgi:hypothetical protein
MATWSADRATERWHGDHAGYDAIALPSQPIITMRDPGRIENRATFPRFGSRSGTRAQGSVP